MSLPESPIGNGYLCGSVLRRAGENGPSVHAALLKPVDRLTKLRSDHVSNPTTEL